MLILYYLPLKTEANNGIVITNPLRADSFVELFDNIAYWILQIAIPLATIVFVWAGFQYITSGGDEKKIEQAKNTLLWGAIGLAVCLIGKGFTGIIKQLLSG